MFEAPKNAVPVGTALGVQFAAVLKSADVGAFSQVAFCAAADRPPAASAVEARSVARS